MKLANLLWEDGEGRQWNSGFSIDDLVLMLSKGFSLVSMSCLIELLDNPQLAIHAFSEFYRQQADHHGITGRQWDGVMTSNFETIVDKWTLACVMLANECAKLSKDELTRKIQDGKQRLAVIQSRRFFLTTERIFNGITITNNLAGF